MATRTTNKFVLQNFLDKAQKGKEVKSERELAAVKKDVTPNFQPKFIKPLTKKQIEQIRLQKLMQKQGQIITYVPQSTASKLKEIALNPLTAFGYAARNESLPENFSKGPRNILDTATDVINPAFYINQGNDAVENVSSSVGNIAQGNYPAALRDIKKAGVNVVNTLPAVAEFGPGINQFIKSNKTLPVIVGDYKVPSIAESIGKYRPYVAESEKGLQPYISQIGESGISRDEEIFRNLMGHEYRNAKELENTIFLDANGNSIVAPINKQYNPHVEDDYMKMFNAKKNSRNVNPVIPDERSILRNSSIIDLNLSELEKQPFVFEQSSIPTVPAFLQKDAILAEQELARANADAATFSNSPFNKQKLQEFRPNQEFNVSNEQARFQDDPLLNKKYAAFRQNGNLDYPESVAEQLTNKRGNYLANDYGDMDDIVMVDKFKESTSNIPTNSAYTDAMHEQTHSRSIRLQATPQEEEIASKAWEPMIKTNDFGMPAEEAFAVQNELRASLGDIKGDKVYTEKDIPEIKNKLQGLIDTRHSYLSGVNVEEFNMPALIKSLNKIGIGAIVPVAGAAVLSKQKEGGSVNMDEKDINAYHRRKNLIKEELAEGNMSKQRAHESWSKYIEDLKSKYQTENGEDLYLPHEEIHHFNPTPPVSEEQEEEPDMQEQGGMLYADRNRDYSHEQTMNKYMFPEQTLMKFMKGDQKQNGGLIPFHTYYQQTIINSRNKS